MGANPHANGGTLLRDLELPDFREYAVDVAEPGTTTTEATRVLGTWLRNRRTDPRKAEIDDFVWPPWVRFILGGAGAAMSRNPIRGGIRDTAGRSADGASVCPAESVNVTSTTAGLYSLDAAAMTASANVTNAIAPKTLQVQ